MKNIINERDMEVDALMIVICHTLDCLINKDCCSLSKKRVNILKALLILLLNLVWPAENPFRRPCQIRTTIH